MALVVANSPQNTQITDAHTFFTSYEECRDEDFIGSLTFEKPQAAHALQAADLVAWANLRKHLKLPFDNGLEPLELLTRDVESEHKPILHFHYPTSAKSVEKLAEVLRAPVRQKGIRSSVLGEFVPDEWKEKIKKLPTE